MRRFKPTTGTRPSCGCARRWSAIPTIPAILSLAARYEQARGDNQRAADYWRASLAAMPATTPVDRLAHELVYPEQDTKSHRAVTAADLQHLLDPDYEPFREDDQGCRLCLRMDPIRTTARRLWCSPIRKLSPPQPPTARGVTLRSDDARPVPIAPDSNPAIRAIPSSQPPNPATLSPAKCDTAWIGFGAIRVWRIGGARCGLSPHGHWTARRRRSADSYGLPTGVAEMKLAQYSEAASPPISANAPHSMASDAWKGLGLLADGGEPQCGGAADTEQDSAGCAPQLEADIEFVQGVASLYVAVGDARTGGEYLNRVENYYLLHRSAAPAGLEVQHAWLLYNLKDDIGLYPVMLRLDARQDLSAARANSGGYAVGELGCAPCRNRDEERQSAARCADAAGRIEGLSGQPGMSAVRWRARMRESGRAADAVTLFKTIPMDNASSGDYQGAISAALGATDMAQAEAWLRQALAHYPNDPQILGLAARFEQARGNNERAADYWRAALAPMPPGAAMKSLDSGLGYPAGIYCASGAG